MNIISQLNQAAIILKDPPIVMATTERVAFLKHLDQVSGDCFTEYINSLILETDLKSEKRTIISFGQKVDAILPSPYASFFMK